VTPGGGWRPRVLVAGTGFGRVYLAALRRPDAPFELAGILARGSARSVACARHYGVPLYTGIDEVPGVDIACVVVAGAVNGGGGAELAQALMARGVHVLQEHPLHHAELAECLRHARRYRVAYHLNANYVHLDSVRAFVDAARRLLARQQPLFVDAVTSVQMLYTLLDILGAALGRLRPWRLSATPAGGALLRTLDGTVRGVPLTLRVQNQIDPRQRDNGSHIMHRVTLGTEGGNLMLVNTQGPVLWSPRLHMPADYRDALTVDDSPAPYLDLPGAIRLDAGPAASWRTVIRDHWPAAAARALDQLRRSVIEGADPLPRGQHHLAVSQLTAEATAALGPPEVVAAGRPEVELATWLVTGDRRAQDAVGDAAPSSQPSPSAR
jgi:pyochelin biosynthetic protein PchG